MGVVSRCLPGLALAACLNPAGADETEPARLRFEPRFVLEAVAQQLGVTLRPEIPMPAIFVASATPLTQFQEAIEAQWRFRPEVVMNTYAIERNEIYLHDGAAYYAQTGRTLDDSLAHELVHYLQARYRNDDLSSELREAEAVAIQTWFREVHVAPATAAASASRRCSGASGS
jgi:hypothetical protein